MAMIAASTPAAPAASHAERSGAASSASGAWFRDR